MNVYYQVSGDYRLKSVNKTMRHGDLPLKTGDLCYKALFDRDTPCVHCPVLGEKKTGSSIFYHEIGKIWIEAIGVELDEDSYGVICRPAEKNVPPAYRLAEHQRVARERELLLELKMVAAAIDKIYLRANAVNLTQDTWKNLSMDAFMGSIISKYDKFSDIILAAAQLVPEDQKLTYLDCFARENQIAAYRSGKKMITLRHQQMDVDGAYHWMETMVIFVDSGTKDICQIALARNIDDEMEKQSTLRRAISEAEAAREAARRANEAKSNFLFSMSHDIRTPMNAITGYTNLLGKHLGDTEKARDYLGKVEASSKYLLSLINDVLEMARIEQGNIGLDEQIVQCDDFLKDVLVVFEGNLREKKLSLTHHSDAVHKVIYLDTVKMREIFLNIISNAVKYTPEGGCISIETAELPDERADFCIYQTKVTDTGIGMSKEFLPHIFEDFSRERTVTENRIIGSGLGMPITKRLVNLMGGTIEVESELGRGTTFTVTIPHRIVSESELESSASSADTLRDNVEFKGKRILMAEDNDLNAEIAIELLRDLGFEVERAEDGIVCISMLQRAAAGYYDLILMDIQMPNMDGYKATTAIRAMEEEDKAAIPILALTANAFDEDKKLALLTGMNGHIAKPINVDELIQTLCSLWR